MSISSCSLLAAGAGLVIFNECPEKNGSDSLDRISMRTLKQKIGSAIIKKVTHYASRIKNKWIPCYHKFLVIETNEGYISLEKNKAGIVMQKHPNPDVVINRIEGEERCESRDEIQRLADYRVEGVTLWELLVEFNIRKQIDLGYRIFTSNCGHFTDLVCKSVEELERKKNEFQLASAAWFESKLIQKTSRHAIEHPSEIEDSPN